MRRFLLIALLVDASIVYRELRLEDYDSGIFDVLGKLTVAPKVTRGEFEEAFHTRKKRDTITLVAVDENNGGRIVGTASMVTEQKLIRNCAIKGHLEDVIVLPEYHGMEIGRTLVSRITGMARDRNFYKVSLQCTEERKRFYGRCGYGGNGDKSNVAMSVYFGDSVGRIE